MSNSILLPWNIKIPSCFNLFKNASLHIQWGFHKALKQSKRFIFFLHKDSVKTSNAFRLQCYRCYRAVKQSDSYREDGRLVEKKKVKAKQSLLKMLLTCAYKPYLNSLKHDDMQEVSLFIKCPNICIIVSSFCHLLSHVNHTTVTKPLPTLADVLADIFFFQTQETCRVSKHLLCAIIHKCFLR